MTASSAATTSTWYCCSSMVSAGGTAGRGRCGSATRPTRRARCCAGSCRGRSCTTCATGSGCWSSTASTSARRTRHRADGRPRCGPPTGSPQPSGYPELAGWLVSRGAAPPALDEVNSLIAAVLAGDRDTTTRLRAFAPEARERRPGLLAWAAAGCKLDAIALLAELGFDVNARGRLDIPLEQQWFTPLHEAAQTGDVEMAQLLLGLGADPNIRSEWGATPLETARQHGQE